MSKASCCPICDKSVRHMKRHLRIHTDERLHTCSVCAKTFTQACTLKTHQATHIDGRSFKCETCGKGFNDRSSLRRHNFIHDDIKPYKCSICGKDFRQSSHLAKHALTHRADEDALKPSEQAAHTSADIEPKSFACKKCNNEFENVKCLKAHIGDKHKKKLKKCRRCGEEFKRRHYKSHKATHFNEKQHACDTCSMTFNHTSGLDSHKLKHLAE